jgi:8-oxo-dGTP pyrophosphatase MutT (NUDIX family)
MNILSTESKIQTLAAANDLPHRLAAALRAGPPRERCRQTMSPELGYGRHAGPAPHTARKAAVVLLLFKRNGAWHLPLTERPDTLTRHAGQISLPGGAVDAGESSTEAALRELHEELGFDAPVTILGQLADCYVFASDFLVAPWVAASTHDLEPIWQPHDHEVKNVIELPIKLLLNDHAIGNLKIERGPLVFRAPCYELGTTRIWGATSIILNELAGLLRQLLEND